MTIKEKTIGIILIVIGVFALLTNLETFSKSIPSQLMPILSPESQLYPFVMIILGILLLYTRYSRRRF